MPTVSVIVPVYNVEKYLSQCIDSILAQTFSDFELILVDDGSPDNCGKICDGYAEKDSRITVIHKENGGLSSARNSAIDWAFKNSNSEWISFIDSDDWVHPQYLEALLSATTTLNADIGVCEYEETTCRSTTYDTLKPIPEKISPEELYVDKHVTSVIACAKLYKKELFRSIRYPVGKLHEDEYVTYKILFEYGNVSYINEKLYFYYSNPNSITLGEWSPKRLDAVAAHEEQIEYFRSHNFTEALKKTEKVLLWYLITQINITQKNDKYSSYSPSLKKKLKACIKDFKKDLNLSFKNDSGIYEHIYPKMTKVYWIFVSALNKILKFRR